MRTEAEMISRSIASLGYDLSSKSCGWGIVRFVEYIDKQGIKSYDILEYRDSGVFNLKEDAKVRNWKNIDDVMLGLKFLHNHVVNQLDKNSSIELVGVEAAYGYDRFLSMFFARISTAVLMAACWKCDTYLVHPSTLKRIVTGNGKAEKAVVMAKIEEKLSIQALRTEKGKIIDSEYDRFDALGVAISCFQYRGVLNG